MYFARKTLQVVSVLAATLLMAEAQPVPLMVPDGTPVRLRLKRNLSSADATVGETVDFEVLDEVVVDGQVVVQNGSTALATVTEAQAKRSMGRAGKLNVNIDSVRLVTGEKAPLRGIKEAKGGGNSGKMTGAMVATSIVFFPAAPLFLFMKGKDITIPKGHEVTVFINGDVRMDRQKVLTANGQQPTLVAAAVQPAAAPAAPPPAPAGKGLTNEDVIALRKAGLGESVIVAKVRSSRGSYRLDASDLVQLKQAGLSDGVIAAMLEARP